jgi:glycosyltransferase involved in cell wall biosynthesis
MSDIRIAFLTDIITPYMVAVLDALAQRSELSAIFCSRTGTRGLGWHQEAELPFRNEVIEGLTVRRSSPDATDYYLSPRILGALRRARPHVVISGGFSFPSVYAAVYGRAFGIPLLIQSDGTRGSEAQLGAEQRFARRVLAPLAWGAVANSEPAARRFVELGFPAGRVFRALHATRIEPFWRVAEGRTTASDGPLRLLSVGRLIPRKGGACLLRAVARANAAGAEVALTVVGSGSEDIPLKALARELGVTVTWCGFIDQPDLPSLYAEADAFAFPTLDDPFGIVLLEAAGAGLPLIASTHAGATEDLVRHGVNGFVVDPLDSAAMAAAIVRLAKEPDLRARMGRAAHVATLNRTPAAAAAGYLQAVEAALAGSG